MKKSGRKTLILAILGLFLSMICTAGNAQVRTEGWYSDRDLAERARAAKQSPELVYIYNHRARPCKLMQEDTFTDPRVSDLMKGFVLLALHERSHRDLVRRLEIFRVPTIVFLDAKGREVDRAVGYKDPAAFAEYLESVLRLHRGELESREDYDFAATNILEARENTRPVTLNYNAPGASVVSVVGDFNDWRIDATPMRQTSDGNWQLTVHLFPGVYEYLFVTEDGEYHPDPNNPRKKANPYGGFNSVLLIGDVKYSPMVRGENVTFIIYNTEAARIQVAGSFNNWEPVNMYRKPDDPGMWGALFTLPPGEYQYKYVIDGEWTLDMENYWPKVDPEGNMNSSFRVGGRQ